MDKTQQEKDEAIERYIEARKNHVPSSEELFEMRAAFGPGAKVVDVITGQVFYT